MPIDLYTALTQIGFPSPIATNERGMAQGMRDVAILSGAGQIGGLTKSRHYSPVQGFARSKVVFATTYPAGTQSQDTDLPDALYFQCALEPVFFAGRSSIPVRQYLYKFNGAKFANYAGPGTNAKGYVESDWLYHPFIDAGQNNKFGLYTYVERQSGTGQMPSSDIGTGYAERYEGYQTFATTQIATDPVLANTSITAMSATQTGTSTSLTPSFMVIDYPTGVKVIAISGDSIAQYVGEGYTGSLPTEDSLGSVLRNCGYPARGIVETLGLSPSINIAKASDGVKFSAAIGAARGRLSRLNRANPTHLFMEENVNDLSGTGLIGTTAAWAVSTMYGFGDVRLNGGNAYMCIRGGISASSGGPTTTAASITDGQAIWRYLGAGVGADREYGIYGRTAQAALAYRNAVPGLSICKAFTTPQSSSTDSFATVVNQTAFWAPPSLRSRLHAIYMDDRTNGRTTIGNTWFEPGLAEAAGGIEIESGYDGTAGGASSKWGESGVGTANWLTTDGTHPNGFGHKTIGDSFTAALFA